MKKQVFHIHDKVLIKNPQIFVRCGYPFGKNYSKENLISPDEKSIVARLVGMNDAFVDDPHYQSEYKVYEKILDELAYLKLKKCGFGGNVRSVHTKYEPHFKNRIGYVIHKRYVRSGKREGGYTSYEGDYQPTCLMNEKAHVILLVSLESDNFTDGCIEIEEIHVEKIP